MLTIIIALIAVIYHTNLHFKNNLSFFQSCFTSVFSIDYRTFPMIWKGQAIALIVLEEN